MTDERAAVTPYLICEPAAEAIAFYERAFGAVEARARLSAPDGTVMNAEVTIGDATLMIADPTPSIGSLSPKGLGGSSVIIVLHLADVDALWARAVAAGAEVAIPLADQFYGDRTGRLRDPFGHLWIVAQQIEDVPEDEMVRRFEALFG